MQSRPILWSLSKGSDKIRPNKGFLKVTEWVKVIQKSGRKWPVYEQNKIEFSGKCKMQEI